MESVTKNRQTAATLHAMVVRAYGSGELLSYEELGDGWFNVAYLIRLRDGRRVVLKIAPPAHVEVMSHERGAMATELAALHLIRSRSSVPVPVVDFADSSHDLCDADYFFMRYIDADNLGLLQLSSSERDHYNAALGAVNRSLNEIRGAWFGSLTGPGTSSWRTCFTDRLDETLHDGSIRGVDLGFGYDVIRVFADTHVDALDEVVTPRLISTDLWDGNTMVRDGRIAGIIDLERAMFGDPLMEVGFAGIDLPDAFGDPTAFIRGYRHPALTPRSRRRRRLYTLLLLLTMIIETEYRAYTTSAQYDFARAQLQQLLMQTASTSRPQPSPRSGGGLWLDRDL
ncbi:aminoglycoside phosphotransferase family protein [Actinoplanes sp. LDG1-06]|uniref:Aminoglycoside phosphotransferase family protein n=1 Tax=Paractinoplanes ovalisporus TaxID=2810368 RepID=A0ABS2AKF9_9ACTN|nr:aminoglycoside phosphotransferase family protein [Actinoplanes ovalisporus]MBM2620306.1 aminoglycoside phosphotransferase family protein [Actinoplanes ovalisporus]